MTDTRQPATTKGDPHRSPFTFDRSDIQLALVRLAADPGGADLYAKLMTAWHGREQRRLAHVPLDEDERDLLAKVGALPR